MDILSLLIERTQFTLGATNKDAWLEKLVKSNENEISIVLTENALNQMRANGESIVLLLEKYSLKAMFDMKDPYANTNVNFFLYVFTKKKNSSILYGLYKDPIRKRSVRTNTFELADEFPDEYFSYIENIESYLSSGICPGDTSQQEFGSINSSIRDEQCWNPNRYGKTVQKVRDALKKEKTIPLNCVAQIIRPRPDAEKKQTKYVAMPGNWQYPVDYNRFREGIQTDCILKKGDIVLFDSSRFFLVYDELNEEVHTSPNCFVIRPQNISPEYLYIYLQSETAKIVMDAESSGAVIRRIRSAGLSNLPIILPVKDNSYYEKLFRVNTFPVNDITEINNAIFTNEETAQDECVEDILDNELTRKLRVCREEVRDRILDEDIKEINICFRNKAYKAALILAGSVLEAVLIDWLSELDGVNYFEEEYYDYQGNKGTLAIYIRDIKYLKRPEWIDEAEKAYAIKDTRNQVHAKLCLKSERINEDLCREVIGYLSDVLKTRNKRSSTRIRYY